MAKFSYLSYIYEITRLAVELPASFDEAWDRFRADVAAGQAHACNTAGLLPDFDFARAGKLWNSMTAQEQEQARETWRNFIRRDVQLALVEARRGELA